jgi:sugar phosphate isomerase/epimerase
MQFVYFTKLLQGLDLPGIIAFLKEAGLDGADLAVRPGYPVTPDNALAELPQAAKQFRDAGLVIGLATAPTTLTDPDRAAARNLFDAAAKAGVAAVKIGYFPYHHGKIDTDLADARQHLAGFAKLAEKTGVRACYHTHSGANLGNNSAGLRLLLQDLDAHHVGAFVDTGHTAVNGGPIGMELDLVRPWLSLLAIKDMLWEKSTDGWRYRVVPAGAGIVRWNEVGAAVRAAKFNGTVSLHGEYETKDLAERKALAKQELAVLRAVL